MKILDDDELKSVKDILAQIKKDKIDIKLEDITEENLKEWAELCISLCELVVEQAEYIKLND